MQSNCFREPLFSSLLFLLLFYKTKSNNSTKCNRSGQQSTMKCWNSEEQLGKRASVMPHIKKYYNILHFQAVEYLIELGKKTWYKKSISNFSNVRSMSTERYFQKVFQNIINFQFSCHIRLWVAFITFWLFNSHKFCRYLCWMDFFFCLTPNSLFELI